MIDEKCFSCVSWENKAVTHCEVWGGVNSCSDLARYFLNKKRGIVNKSDIITIYGLANMDRQQVDGEFHIYNTLFIDLSQSIDEVFNSFQKSTRQHIRRAARDGYFSEVISSEKLKDDESILYGFYDSLSQMFSEKGISTSKSVIKRCRAHIDQDLLTMCISKTPDGSIVSYHVYVNNYPIIRSLYGVSNYRDFETTNLRNEIGKANKKAYYDDMQFFKSEGYSIFDFGGAGKTEDVRSITEFKKKFGGEEAETLEYYMFPSFKGKVIKKFFF